VKRSADHHLRPILGLAHAFDLIDLLILESFDGQSATLETFIGNFSELF
jgi:hypothetical protein